MSQQPSLGFHYKVELPWLDTAATLVASGVNVDRFRSELDARLLRDSDVELTGRGRSKAIGVMARMWLEVSPAVEPVRDDALALLPRVLPEERHGVHWAMALATFPFFRDVAATTGKLARLQGSVDMASIKRRIAESWGERSTVSRATGIVVGTMRDWGAVVGNSREVLPSTPLPVSESISTLLIQSLLLSEQTPSLPLSDTMRHPANFPFALQTNADRLRETHTLCVDRLGNDTDVVSLDR